MSNPLESKLMMLVVGKEMCHCYYQNGTYLGVDIEQKDDIRLSRYYDEKADMLDDSEREYLDDLLMVNGKGVKLINIPFFSEYNPFDFAVISLQGGEVLYIDKCHAKLYQDVKIEKRWRYLDITIFDENGVQTLKVVTPEVPSGQFYTKNTSCCC